MTIEPVPQSSLDDGAAAGERGPVLAVGKLHIGRLVRYAGASGDFNPIHHDPEFARSLGHPGVMAMGMLPGAILGAYAERWLAPMRIARLSLRFADRIWPDEELECHGLVVSTTAGAGGIELAAELWVATVAGGVKVRGVCTALGALDGA